MATSFFPNRIAVGTELDPLGLRLEVGTENLLRTLTATLTNGGTKIRLRGASPLAVADAAFYSRLFNAPLTVSGQITFTLWAESTTDGNAALRAELYKITYGGSDVETLIAVAETGEITTQQAYVVNVTPDVPVIVGEYERLILRFYAIPAPSETMAAGTLTFRFNDAAGTGNSTVLLTETATFKTVTAPIELARVAGEVAGFWRASLVAPGDADRFFKTQTEPSGTELLWTDPGGAHNFTEPASAVAAINDTANDNAYVSASFTPIANRLYLLFVVHSDSATEATVPTISTTTGLAFVQIGSSLPFNTIAANVNRITAFRAMKSSGLSNGTYTVNFGDNSTGCLAQLVMVPYAQTTGSDGANAVVNVSTNSADAGANPSVTLGTFAQPYHMTIAAFGSDIATGPTVPAPWKNIGSINQATPTSGMWTMWREGNYTTLPSAAAAVTLASSDWAGIAVEIARAAAPVAQAFISPRFKKPYRFKYYGTGYPSAGSVLINAEETGSDANAKHLFRIYRWHQGTETLIVEMSGAEIASLGSPETQNFSLTTAVTDTSCGIDDRLVMRMYVANTGTMGGHRSVEIATGGIGTATSLTLNQDSNIAEWKASGDPDDLVDNLATMGIS